MNKKKVALGFVGALVAVLAIYQIYAYATLPSTHTQSASVGRGTAVTARVTQDCPGYAETRTYYNRLTPVNTKFCQLRGVVKQGCVSWFDVDGFLLIHSCEGDIPSKPSGIYYVRADSSAIVRLNHCQPFAPGNLVDTCS